MFILKCDLEKLQADADQDSSSSEEKIRREQRSSNSSQGRLALPKKCIFAIRLASISRQLEHARN